MTPAEPLPRGFVENAWYEQLALIAREQPRRFFLFSRTTKNCLRVYLDLKEKHQAMKHAA